MTDNKADRLSNLLHKTGFSPSKNDGHQLMMNMASLLSGAPDSPITAGSSIEAQIKLKAMARRNEIEKDMDIPSTRISLTQMPPARELIALIHAERQESEKHSGKGVGGKDLKSTFAFIGDPKCYSTARLQDLKRVNIKDLSTRKQNEGVFLLCRMISLPSSRIAFALADPEGNSIIAELSDFPILPITLGQVTIRDVEATFPLHSIFAIKEPKVVVVDQRNGQQALKIRIDSPTDLLRLQRGDERLEGLIWAGLDGQGPRKLPEPEQRSLQEWKEYGNKFYKARQFVAALEAFSTGLQEHSAHPEKYYLLCNRAAANLTLERYGDAFADAMAAKVELTKARVTDSSAIVLDLSEKSQLRVAKAYYGLRRYSDALREYKAVFDIRLDSVEAKNGVEKAEQRLREQSHRQYDWLGMYQASVKIPNARLDVADYIGPVKVAESYGKDRGLFVTKKVKAGDILLVAKAVEVTFQEDLAKSERVYTYNLHNSSVDMLGGAPLRAALAYRLYNDPSLAKSFDNLYAGPGRSTPDSGIGLAKSFAGAPLRGGEYTLDMGRVDDIITFNAFLADPMTGGDIQGITDGVTKMHKVSNDYGGGGIWENASYINHACIANAVRFTIGDVVIIKALEDLPCGAEITVPYNISKMYYLARTEELKKFLIGHCGCRCCVDDRKDGDASREKRDELMYERMQHMKVFVARLMTGGGKPSREEELASIEQLLADISATYNTSRGPIRPEFAEFAQAACQKIASYWRPPPPALCHKAINYGKAALEANGIVLRERLKSPLYATTKVASSVPKGLCILTAPKEHRPIAVKGMLQLAGLYRTLKDSKAEKEWMNAYVPSFLQFHSQNRES